VLFGTSFAELIVSPTMTPFDVSLIRTKIDPQPVFPLDHCTFVWNRYDQQIRPKESAAPFAI
jgi:hypothetical protein